MDKEINDGVDKCSFLDPVTVKKFAEVIAEEPGFMCVDACQSIEESIRVREMVLKILEELRVAEKL